MSLLLRVVIYLPVLFLIALVVVGQHHSTAAATIRGAVQRTVRWAVWSACLVAVMLLLELLFIGF
ncbi:MAG: hypothetical protein H6838_11375 [Planctomycetes bacterium]|nr:hypothetical protein [Planctomycetota bacterium]